MLRLECGTHACAPRAAATLLCPHTNPPTLAHLLPEVPVHKLGARRVVQQQRGGQVELLAAHRALGRHLVHRLHVQAGGGQELEVQVAHGVPGQGAEANHKRPAEDEWMGQGAGVTRAE